MRAATILHADLDAFFASVEQRDDPRLRGRPTIVGSWVVMAASYEARAFGVHGGMSGARARRLCPDARFVDPRFDAYVDASRAVFGVFERTSPVVEGISIDEAFLDVRGMDRIAGTPAEIAAGLRREVRDRVGLPITVGVATTKSLAKVASGLAKPDGLLVVPPGRELAFLRPLPVERLWGVGPATAARLRARGLATVGQVAAMDVEALSRLVGGASGRHLHALANNRDWRPVRAGRRRRSFGAQSALRRGPRQDGELDRILLGLAERVTGRMRRAGRAGRTVTIRLRFDDYSRVTRSRTMPRRTAGSGVVLRQARQLLMEAAPMIAERGITLLGIAVSNLDDDPQLELPFPDPAGGLDAALDAVRERFGAWALVRASLLGRERGYAIWVHPGEEAPPAARTAPGSGPGARRAAGAPPQRSRGNATAEH